MFIEPICFYCADQNPHRDRSLGITRYTCGLLQQLSRQGVAAEAIVSSSSFSLPGGVQQTLLPFATDGALGRLLADHLHPALVRSSAKIWHYPKGFLPFVVQKPIAKVGTIADTILQYHADHYPESRSKLSFTYWIAMLRHSIANFDRVITVSETSRLAIEEFAARYRLRCPPVVVTYEGVHVDLTVPEPKHPADYVVHIASSQPHKRTDWLLEHWPNVERELGTAPPLWIIGSSTARQQALVATLRNVRLLGPLQRRDFELTISRARALILPSEVEGFGLPAVEAYLLGTPVVFVRGTAVEEILGPGTQAGFSSAQGDRGVSGAVVEATSITAAAIEAKRARLLGQYSWKACIDRTIQVYDGLL